MDDLDTQAADDAAVHHAASEPGGKPSFAMTDGGGADPTHSIFSTSRAPRRAASTGATCAVR